jgi:hypothetical protein
VLKKRGANLIPYYEIEFYRDAGRWMLCNSPTACNLAMQQKGRLPGIAYVADILARPREKSGRMDAHRI